MSKNSQRKHSHNQFMQSVYKSGFKLGKAEKPLEFYYLNKKVNNKYVLGWKHGLASNIV